MDNCSEPSDDEEDQLDGRLRADAQSRLGCQCIPNGKQDIVVEIPDWNRNLSREGEPQDYRVAKEPDHDRAEVDRHGRHRPGVARADAEVDPMSVRFTDLHRWVCELDNFADDQESNEAKLEAIQMAWLEERQDNARRLSPPPPSLFT